MRTQDLIPADVRPRLKQLRLASRYATATQGFGPHRSDHRGAGLEFAQYRAYEPGDDPRQVDWKLYARSDRYFVRESERESPLTVWIVIDASASMTQGDAARAHWSRLDAARGMAACLVDVAVREGDRFGIASLHSDGPRFIPAGMGPRQRDRCLLALQRLEAAGPPCDAMRLKPMWEQLRARSLVITLSDLFDDQLTSLLKQLAAVQRDVATIQLLTPEERDFPFVGGQEFRDPETGERLLTDAPAVRAEFLSRFTDAREALARELATHGIRHAPYWLDQPIDAPLQQLFGTRR